MYRRGQTQEWLTRVAMKWDSDQCLFYPFGIGSHGYGQANVFGIKVLAHRVICEAENGLPPTPKHDAAHRCGNKTCVNRKHLRWATRSENNADKIVHGRHIKGSDHGQAKLTPGEVFAIRLSHDSQRDIASRFGICQQTVSDIRCKRRWGWL